MVLNSYQLIKFRCRDSSCSQDTVSRAAGLHSAGMGFCRAIWQFYRDPKLTPVNRDSSIYQDYPIWQLYRDPKRSAFNRDYPISTALFGQRNFQPSTGTLSGPKASSRLPGFCKNSCQRVPLSATQLNRRAVSGNHLDPVEICGLDKFVLPDNNL